MTVHLKDFEIVLNRDCPHIKIEYRYDDIINHTRYCIYLFDEGLVGLHHFILFEEKYIEKLSILFDSINAALMSINYTNAA